MRVGPRQPTPIDRLLSWDSEQAIWQGIVLQLPALLHVEAWKRGIPKSLHF
jgi:hypothetical protein